ncbi:hypothetical protein AGMMS50230_22420 [Spirochaetia bacterium]|nr:hypothetical protein AGMMS50230_22420 [Spirochaetia bacterium]
MKNNKFSVLGLLSMVLIFGFVQSFTAAQTAPTAAVSIAGTSWTTFYVDEDEYDEMFMLVFGKNNIRVDKIEHEVTGRTFTSFFSSTYDVGTWSQTGKNINVKFIETIWDKNFIMVRKIFWEFKLTIIDEKTMEGIILNNGEIIGNAELYKK